MNRNWIPGLDLELGGSAGPVWLSAEDESNILLVADCFGFSPTGAKWRAGEAAFEREFGKSIDNDIWLWAWRSATLITDLEALAFSGALRSARAWLGTSPEALPPTAVIGRRWQERGVEQFLGWCRGLGATDLVGRVISAADRGAFHLDRCQRYWLALRPADATPRWLADTINQPLSERIGLLVQMREEWTPDIGELDVCPHSMEIMILLAEGFGLDGSSNHGQPFCSTRSWERRPNGDLLVPDTQALQFERRIVDVAAWAMSGTPDGPFETGSASLYADFGRWARTARAAALFRQLALLASHGAFVVSAARLPHWLTLSPATRPGSEPDLRPEPAQGELPLLDEEPSAQNPDLG